MDLVSGQPGQSCRRCGMCFAITPPEAGAEITRCAEAGCGRRFWHRDGGEVSDAAGQTVLGRSVAPVAVGIDPAWSSLALAPPAALLARVAPAEPIGPQGLAP